MGAKLREFSSSLDDSEKRGLSKTELMRSAANNESAWNHVDFAHKEKREKAITDLEEFQKSTGIDESKHIEDLKNATSNYEINSKIQKIKKAGVKWAQQLMNKSGLWEPMDPKERSYILDEKRSYLGWLKGLDLTGEDGLINAVKTMESGFDGRRSFRNKLRTLKEGKNPLAFKEFFRRLPSIPLYGSKEALLKNVEENLKEVEDMPHAVQFEFKKQQKESKAHKKTDELVKGLQEKHASKKQKYTKSILGQLQNFGGRKIQTPYGKIPETAYEFIQWFDERESFAEMDDAQKKLPGLIKQRKKLYDKRNQILEHTAPKDKARLMEKTNLMRRHELKRYLPDLEKQVQKNNIHVADYMTSIIGARRKGVDLFQGFEQTRKIGQFKLKDFGTQQRKLKQLDEEIDERAQTVEDYFTLPSYLRKDQQFIASNAIDREKLLFDAKEAQNREQKSAFDTDHLDQKDLNATDNREIADDLENTFEGKKATESVLKEMRQEGLMQQIDIQQSTRNRIKRTAEAAAQKKMTQKEYYLDDLKGWTFLRKDIKKDEEAITAREKNKLKFINLADEAYDLGHAFSSGGEIDRLQTIDFEELRNGSKKVEEKLNEAKYAEHIMITERDGRDALDPLEMIDDMSQQQMMQLIMVAIEKLGRKHLNLGNSNMQMMKNSSNIQKTMATEMIGSEFGYEAANNNDGFKDLTMRLAS
jgi:hypothetical protein